MPAQPDACSEYLTRHVHPDLPLSIFNALAIKDRKSGVLGGFELRSKPWLEKSPQMPSSLSQHLAHLSGLLVETVSSNGSWHTIPSTYLTAPAPTPTHSAYHLPYCSSTNSCSLCLAPTLQLQHQFPPSTYLTAPAPTPAHSA